MAVFEGDGDAYTYSDGTWSSGVQVSSGGGLAGVSCASSSFCMAVDNSGNAYTYSDGTWSSADEVEDYGGGAYSLTGVSCPSSSFCIGVDNEAHEYTRQKANVCAA